MIKGRVTILGRPNVGKSTLFNRLTRVQKSIVANRPGVTRDVLIGKVWNQEQSEGFELCDTGGYETKKHSFQPFSTNLVWKQTQSAVENSDLVIMLFDAKEGLHTFDSELVNMLRKTNRPTIFAANKVDGIEQIGKTFEFQRLGIESILSISAAHNLGIKELTETIISKLKNLNIKITKQNKVTEEPKVLAIIGRPNAGKSSIINRLVDKERTLVSPISGTTRDSIDIYFSYNKNPYTLVDTAGVRRQQKIKDLIESESIKRSIRAINRAHLIIYTIAADQGITDQDTKLIQYATRKNKPILLVINKWDLMESDSPNAQELYKKNIFNNSLRDLSYIKVHFTSCLHNKRIPQILPQIEILLKQTAKKVTTSVINQIVNDISSTHSPRLVASSLKRPKFYYSTQVDTSPPSIVIKCNIPKELEQSYKKYFIKQLQKRLEFTNVPIAVYFRDKHENTKKSSSLKSDENGTKLPKQAAPSLTHINPK